ncbi:MAG: hypothetical protein R3325_00965 [Thermoanaerobaculia bacterium]|nr:hypothetical protein [Thermoanaerobaculia bacterium]
MTLRSTIGGFAAACAALALVLTSAAPAEAQFGTRFGKNKVRYKDFDWTIYHSPHFDVYFYEEEAHLLQKVVSFAESAYDQLSQELDFKIEDPIPLIFYQTHSDFEQNNIILNFIPEGLGAFATPVRNRMVLPVDLTDPELMALILHELTHVFQYEMIFGGNLGKGVAARPPLWFMEGMASYFARDEGAREKMFLRDAVVNDLLPSVQDNVGGFFAYRYGNAVFEFIEERWGKESVRDFIIETRNTLGGRVGRAVQRTFAMTPEDFDAEFRRWLRRRYLRELVETGEPGDFGRPYRAEPGGRRSRGTETSPVASPSGDLVAAFTNQEGQVDVVLFDNNSRTLLKNLTKGFGSDFQYLVAQEQTLGRKMGRDLAFSPDGNLLAFFARKEGGRHLVLMNVLSGRVERVISPENVEQQLAPAFSPDGRKVAFAAHRGGNFDIFEIDLDTGATTQITDDEIFDGAPTYSPDGESMVITSVVGGYAKLFQIRRDGTGERFPLRTSELSKSNETDPVFSPDGKTLYFTSDGTGANNIFSLDLESGKVQQHTNAVTGCFQPAVLPSPTGEERLVYTAFWKGNFDIFQTDLDDPITEPIVITEEQIAGVESEPVADVARFEPAIEVSVDDANMERYGGFNFFIDDVGGAAGVSDDQTFIAVAQITFSDFLGDRRIFASFQSIESFQNFDVVYVDLTRRLRWQGHLYDNRDFFLVRDPSTGFFDRGRQAISITGASASLVYPLNVSQRIEAGLSYNLRELDFVSQIGVPLENLSDQDLLNIVEEFNLVLPPGTEIEDLRDLFRAAFGDIVPITVIEPRDDDYPEVRAAFVGDSATFAPFGAVTGRRYNLGASWAPDTEESGTLTSAVYMDFRQYVPLTKRTNLAIRAWGTARDGNFATPVYFGGLDTVRGFPFRSLVGDRGFYTNFELRFPLVDLLATPIFAFQGIRGVVFLDVAGAWFNDFQSFRFWDETGDGLGDAVSSYGYGVSARLLGLEFNWDFAKRWDFDRTLSGLETSFWIGSRF